MYIVVYEDEKANTPEYGVRVLYALTLGQSIYDRLSYYSDSRFNEDNLYNRLRDNYGFYDDHRYYLSELDELSALFTDMHHIASTERIDSVDDRVVEFCDKMLTLIECARANQRDIFAYGD